jgi:MFS family permease
VDYADQHSGESQADANRRGDCDLLSMEVGLVHTFNCPGFLIGDISGNGLVSYYINLILEGVGITSPNTKAAINGGLQVWNLVAAMTGAMLIDKLGRRTLFIISNIGMLFGELWRTVPFTAVPILTPSWRLRPVDRYHRSFQRVTYYCRC